MYRFTLLGGRLPHSLSPQIHRCLLRLSGQEGEYTLTETGDQAPGGWMPQLLELDGFNVTIPHKEAVIPFLKGLDPTAEAIGAVNTVYRGIGYNTDLLGFTSALEILGQPLARPESVYFGSGRNRAHDGCRRSFCRLYGMPWRTRIQQGAGRGLMQQPFASGPKGRGGESMPDRTFGGRIRPSVQRYSRGHVSSSGRMPGNRCRSFRGKGCI